MVSVVLNSHAFIEYVQLHKDILAVTSTCWRQNELMLGWTVNVNTTSSALLDLATRTFMLSEMSNYAPLQAQ